MNKSPQSPKEPEKNGFLSSSPKLNLEKLVFHLLIFFLPFQLGKHFWPDFSQVLGIRVDYLSPTLYLSDLLVILLFAIVVLKKTKPIKFPFAAIPPVIIFFLYLLVSLILSPTPPLSFYGLIKFAELFFLSAYIAKNIKSKEELPHLVSIFAMSVCIQSFLAIAQYIHQGSLNGVFYFLGERSFNGQTPGIANASINDSLVLRPYGTFPHPNVLAGFLLIALILIYSFPYFKTGLLKKMLKISSLVLGSIALLLTLSRIPILAWLSLIVLLLINKSKKLTPLPLISRIIILSAILVAISLAFYFTPVIGRLQSSSIFESSMTQRLELISDTQKIIWQRPLFGVGLYNFIPALSHVQKNISPVFYLQPVHNIFLLIIAELGFIGFAFVAYFLIKTTIRLYKKTTPASAPLLIILVTIIILGQFDHYWITLQQGQLLLAVILGLSWAF